MLKIILYLELFYSQLIHQKVISYFFFFLGSRDYYSSMHKNADIFSMH